MLRKESLRTFIYRQAGDEFESRVSLLKHLAARIRVYGHISVDAKFEVFNEAAYEDVPPAQYTEAWLHPNGNLTPDTVWCLDDSEALKCYAVLAFDEKNPDATVYPQIKLIAVHLRQMLADELDVVDFDGIVRHAYILEKDKAKWDAVVESFHTAAQQESEKQAVTQTNKPIQRSRAQDEAILAAIKNSNHDPQQLPKNAQGKRGIKFLVRTALKTNSLFVSTKVFDIAWERLAKAGDIAYLQTEVC